MGAQEEEKKDVESTAKKIPYPKSVFCILANEFCERFSYYGMRAVLTIYLKNVLKFNEDNATIIYHAFAMLCYFTPLLGAMIADSLLGKFRTIFYLTVVYAAGSVVLALAATPPISLPAVPISMIGLVLIAFGTGGIKPCVSAFGGDQFQVPEQAKQLASFFSIFYFTINSGSLISTLVTPVFRKDIQCFGDDTCYSLAFAVPAALMVVSLVVFLIGRPFYRIKSPEGNVFVDVVKTIFHALSRKRKSHEKKGHWMDYAGDKYSKRNIEEIKILLRVLFLYLPLPFFWALFDQQGSRWTFQATRMDGDIGFFFVKPDQMQVANPLLILLFIPIFEKLVYPALASFGLLKKPLQRMATGGVFAGIAFVVSGLIELQLKTTYPAELVAGQTHLNLINMAPFPLAGTLVSADMVPGPMDFNIDVDSNYIFGSVVSKENYTIKFDGGYSGCKEPFTLYGEKATSIVILWENDELVCVTPTAGVASPADELFDTLDKDEEGKPFVKIIQYGIWDKLPEDVYSEEYNRTWEQNKWNKIGFEDTEDRIYYETFEFMEENDDGVYSDWRSTPTRAIEFHEYEIYIGTANEENPATGKNETISVLPDKIDLKLGGSYIVAIVKNGTDSYKIHVSEVVSPNSMHMFWLLPQYIIMTAGEVMFSVTIMDFSYSQAPVSMKSVMQSAWLLTVAFGNLIDVIVAAAKIFDEQWKEFFFFAGLMFADMIVFSYLAYRYQPADPNVLLANLDDEKDKDEGNNDAYEGDKQR